MFHRWIIASTNVAILFLLCQQPVPSTAQDVDMRVKVLLEEPFVMPNKLDPTGYEGMFIDILQKLTEKSRADLSYIIDPVPHTKHGYQDFDGNWTGLIGSLVRNESDLVVAPLTIASKRQGVVDFTLPIMSSGLRILFKPANPWSDTESFTILWAPFTAGMWAVLVLMFLVVSVMFWAVGRFSPYEDHAFVGKAATYEGLTLTNSFLYVFSSLTFQGYTAAPRSLSGRVLAAFWWMFVLLVIAAYTASLCSIFLAFKPSMTSLPFATFTELSQQSHVAYGCAQGGSTERYLSSSKQPLQRRLWGTINAHRDTVMVKNTDEGIHRVRANPGKYAFIMEGPIAEYLSEQQPCDLMTIGEELSEHNWGFACRKGTTFCSKLNKYILQLWEEGVIYDLKRKWFHQGCQREDTGDYIFHGVSYIDTFGGTPKYYADRAVTLRRFGMGFLCIIIGMVLSACLLVGEVFYAKRRGTPVPSRIARVPDDLQRIDREYRDDEH